MKNFFHNWSIIIVCFAAAALILFLTEGVHAQGPCFLDDDVLICPGKPPVIIFTD